MLPYGGGKAALIPDIVSGGHEKCEDSTGREDLREKYKKQSAICF